MEMNNKEVAQVLEEIGTLLELRGENPFKCRAFHNASRTIGALTRNIGDVVAENGLRTIKGIGESLAKDITEMVTKGRSSVLDDLRSSLPAGVPAMLRIQGLGPKKVKVLYEKLKIKSVAELKKAAERHALEKVEGFGRKTEENILQGIELLSKHSDKHLYSEAQEAASRILEQLTSVKGVRKCEIAGSLRRKKEIIGDIDILASADAKSTPSVMKAFTSHPDVERIIAEGDTKSSVLLKSGINCDLRVVEEREFPFALAYFTGSKEHNVEMRSLAKTFGWSLNEYGFSALDAKERRGRAKEIVKCKDEADIYRALKLAYVPPEMRESMGEIDAARDKALPDLIVEDDLRGTFHCHTTYSDGANTLREMVDAARELGWEYLGIADHSKIAAYAGGLNESRVKQQHKEIDTLNREVSPFRVFKGSEVDILPDGSLDFADKTLESFDYVVASIHSKFKMTEREATNRIIRALKNKYVTMLGHATGRLLLQRDGYPVNMIDVINAASDYGKIIEINSHPLRLDLDWRLCKYAKEKGVRVSINPDAHTTGGLRDVRYGVGIARKGWLEASDVLNTSPRRELEKMFGA